MRFCRATQCGTIVPILIGIVVLCTSNVCAQFSGSVIIAGNSATNVVGIDTAAPDKVFEPTISLEDKIIFSHLTHVDIEASFNPNVYTHTPDNTFTKVDLSAIGNFYLSEDLFHKGPPIKTQPAVAAAPKADSIAQGAPEKKDLSPSALVVDSVSVTAENLSLLSVRLDSLTINIPGISDDDSIDAATDLKDSLSESVLAVSEVLSTQQYSESIQQVLTEEIANDIKLLTDIPLQPSIRDSIFKVLKTASGILKQAAAKNDILAMPQSPLDTTKKRLPPPVVAAITKQANDNSEEPAENAPDLTLVNPLTDLSQFSSMDNMIREDVAFRSGLTLATLLSVPFQYEQQTNQPKYKAFSYHQMTFMPRLSFYPGQTAGLGLMYGFTDNTYPSDTIFTYQENRVRFDSRVGIASIAVLSVQVGVGFRDYVHPLVTFDTTGTKRKPVITRTVARENFSQIQIGAASTFIVSERCNLGIGYAVTSSPNLRSYLLDLAVGRSAVGGKASDDDYSYKLGRLFLLSNARIFWDLNFNTDLAFEHRQYAAALSIKNPKLAQLINNRSDNGTIITVDIARDFYLTDRLISMFDLITPELNFEYSNYTSTVKQYTYNNFSSTLSVSLAF